MNTSLQNIVNNNSKDLQAETVNQLFHHKDYPQFELKELYLHPIYKQNDHFRFFIDVLQEWNRKIQKNQIHNSSQTLYNKNIFILNSLRNAVRQYKCNSQYILNQLYLWFNQTRNAKVKFVEKRPPPQQFDEEWKIRNTFKSNLPAQIDLYRRRIFWDYKNIHHKTSSSFQQKKKTLPQSSTMLNMTEIQKKRIIKIQNELVRADRQEQELMIASKKWKLKKQRENEINTKNFYKETFSNNKTFFPLKNIENKMMKINSKIVQSKRVHTSMGFRTKNNNDLNSFRRSETITNTLDKLVKKSSNFSTCDQVQGKINDDFAQFGLCNLDGMRLLSNPFEKKLKLKKKKRRN